MNDRPEFGRALSFGPLSKPRIMETTKSNVVMKGWVKTKKTRPNVWVKTEKYGKREA